MYLLLTSSFRHSCHASSLHNKQTFIIWTITNFTRDILFTVQWCSFWEVTKCSVYLQMVTLLFVLGFSMSFSIFMISLSPPFKKKMGKYDSFYNPSLIPWKYCYIHCKWSFIWPCIVSVLSQSVTTRKCILTYWLLLLKTKLISNLWGFFFSFLVLWSLS